MEKLLAGIVIALGLAAFLVVGTLWGGFAFQQIWNWFAFPFTPIKLTLAQACGVCLLISMIRGYRYRKTEEGEGSKTFIFVLLYPGMALLTGWVVQHYV